MTTGAGRANVLRMLTQGLAMACVLGPWITVAQGLTGTLIGTVTDEAGGVKWSVTVVSMPIDGCLNRSAHASTAAQYSGSRPR